MTGIVPATIALLMTRRRPGWVARVSVIAFVLSALSTTLLIVFLAMHDH
jgi:ABC-type lipoprotein release transport system permease subunit